MNNDRRLLLKSIIYHNWFIWIAFISCIQPDYLLTIRPIATAMNYCNIIVFVILVLDMIIQQRLKVNPVMILIFLINAMLILSSIYNHANVSYSVSRLIMIMNVCMITHSNLQHNSENFIRSVYVLLYACITVNFITLLVFPNGLYYSYYEYYHTQIAYLKHWFLSATNNFVIFVFPAFILDRIRLFRKGKFIDIYSITLYIMGMYGMFTGIATTSLIGCIAFFIYLIIIIKKNLPSPSMKTYIILGGVLFVALVFMNVPNLFSDLLIQFLGKDTTFTGRSSIWLQAINFIKERPLTGYGFEYQADMVSKFEDNTATHCHNLYLDLCYRSGIFSLILFVVMLFICAQKLKPYKKDLLCKTISFALFVYIGILFQMEAYFNLCLFYMIVIFVDDIKYWISNPKKNGGKAE